MAMASSEAMTGSLPSPRVLTGQRGGGRHFGFAALQRRPDAQSHFALL